MAFSDGFFSRSQDEARSRGIIEAIGGSSFDENQVLKFLSEIQGHVPWALVASKNLRIAMDLGLDQWPFSMPYGGGDKSNGTAIDPSYGGMNTRVRFSLTMATAIGYCREAATKCVAWCGHGGLAYYNIF